MLCLTALHVCDHLGVVEEAPLHAIALRQVRDGALQHRRVAGADRQVGQIEADALEVQVLLPPALHTSQVAATLLRNSGRSLHLCHVLLVKHFWTICHQNV